MQIEIEFQDRLYQQVMRRLADEAGHPKRMLAAVGEALKPVYLERHRRGVDANGKPWAPLKPSTLAVKKSRFPLYETGQMLQLHYQPGNDTLSIGTSDWKAAWHHYGTGLWGPKKSAYEIKPKNGKALAWGRFVGKSGKFVQARSAVGREFVRKSVMHPGVPAREIVGYGLEHDLVTRDAAGDYYKAVLSRIK